MPGGNVYRWRFMLALAGTLVVAPWPAFGQDKREYASNVYYDFRKPPISPDLTLVGDKDEVYVKQEPEGMRITLPKTWIHPFGGVGYRTENVIRGDFEITASYEILHADEPPKGFGVGVSLRVRKAGSGELANVSRVLRAGGRQVALWNRSIETPGEKTKYPEGVVLCADKIGRLRLRRANGTLYFGKASGMEGEDFDEFNKVDFGTNDIQHVMVIAHTGREACDVDARFVDLRIRSGAAPAVTTKNAVPVVAPADADARAAAPRGMLMLVVVLGAGLVLLFAAGLGGWLLLRRRQPLEEAESDEAAVLTCSECGKKFKVRNAAGKKLKCPRCGTVA